MAPEACTQLAESIVESILDRGLSHSTWRDAHPFAFTDLRTYRKDLISDASAVLQAFYTGLGEPSASTSLDNPKVQAPYQRLVVEDIERRLEWIRKAADEGDHETAHSLEDELFLLVIQKLSYRGSRIARIALQSKNIEFKRDCA